MTFSILCGGVYLVLASYFWLLCRHYLFHYYASNKLMCFRTISYAHFVLGSLENQVP
jgi:hypothetical protein